MQVLLVRLPEISHWCWLCALQLDALLAGVSKRPAAHQDILLRIAAQALEAMSQQVSWHVLIEILMGLVNDIVP